MFYKALRNRKFKNEFYDLQKRKMLNKTVINLTNNKTLKRIIVDFQLSLFMAYLFENHYKAKIERRIKNKFGKKDFPDNVWDDIDTAILAMIRSLRKTLKKRDVSLSYLSNIFSILFKEFSQGTKRRKKLKEKYNLSSTPGFVTISPTNICNLKCKGCYAGKNYDKYTLDFDVFDWILREMKEKLGTLFFVISGGEPFAYRSKGKTIMDIFSKHKDRIFLVYTNGTFINRKIAKKLSRLGNVLPAISVEGFKEETDTRRGKGVYEKIVSAMENLRKEGALFGISVTPMKHNAHLLVSDDFIKFWFDEQGASFAWYFQYMPIGKNPNMDLLVTPEQRERMWKKIWQHIRNGYFIADFWNCGTMSRGCISAAKNGGYFHILWNGDITPCVFMPFKDKNNKLNNIYTLKKKNLSIADAIKTSLFREVREWQKAQEEHTKTGKKCRNCNGYGCGNLLMPCPIRDNSREFYKILKKTRAIPFDEGAVSYREMIKKGVMPAYNDLCRKKMDFLWKEYYLNNRKRKV